MRKYVAIKHNPSKQKRDEKFFEISFIDNKENNHKIYNIKGEKMINTLHFKSFHKKIKKADSIKKKIKKANETLKKAYVELKLNNIDFATTNISEIANLIELTKRIEKIYYQGK